MLYESFGNVQNLAKYANDIPASDSHIGVC